MKLLLVDPPFYLHGAISGHGGHLTPLNLLYIASYIRQQQPDVDVQVLDADAEGLTIEQTLSRIVQHEPDLVGLTANTCAFTHVMELTHCLKREKPDLPVVLGGPHVSALPIVSLEESGADFGVFGEGEVTCNELVAWLRQDSPRDDLASIDGLVFRDASGPIRQNAPRKLLADLDELPFPALDLVETTRYQAAPTKRVAAGFNAMICTSRGCPHNCGFCGAQTTWTRRVRKRSPDNIIEEIRWVKEAYQAASVNFSDEFFTADIQRVQEICRKMIEQKLVLPWVCMARAERLDEDTLALMKRAGCRQISFGIESGNPAILRRIDKSLDLEEAVRVVRRTKRAGIKTHASYIIGYLDETEETIRDTIDFAKRLNTTVAAFFIASPLPGTAFYEEAKERNLLRDNVIWEHYSPLSNAESVIDFPNLSAAQIRRLHRRAIREYYLRPKYIFTRVLQMRHKYELLNMINGVRLLFSIRN